MSEDKIRYKLILYDMKGENPDKPLGIWWTSKLGIFFPNTFKKIKEQLIKLILRNEGDIKE